jgi:hypothetical protein
MTWNRSAGRWRTVVYGQGGAWRGRWGELGEIRAEQAFDRVEYVGDIDVAGLEIPLSAAAPIERTIGIPFFLAEDLYALMLDHGTVQGTAAPPVVPADIPAFLPPGIREQILSVLRRGRIAQETLRLEVLLRGLQGPLGG